MRHIEWRWCSISQRPLETGQEGGGRHYAGGLLLLHPRKRLGLPSRDLARLQALGADAQRARPTVNHGSDRLKIRQLSALRSLHDARSTTAVLPGFPASSDGGPTERPFAADITHSRHPMLLFSENGQRPNAKPPAFVAQPTATGDDRSTGPAATPGRHMTPPLSRLIRRSARGSSAGTPLCLSANQA